MSESMTQLTFDGEPSEGRRKPETLLYCTDCEDTVLRSERFSHEHDLTDANSVEQQRDEEAKEAVKEEARVETQRWQITFHDEHVERVFVEAATKHEAKEIAKEERTYTGEFIQTIHTETDAHGEPSAASIEYLEKFGLLPDDHDVTVEDLERALEAANREEDDD
jgi:hypothetical protein